MFGFSDDENKDADSYTALINTKGPMWFRRIRILTQKVFLKYNIIKGCPEYTFVDGRKWLLPVAWIKRFFIILKRENRMDTIGIMNRSFISKDELDDRKKLLESMGLINR